MTNYLLQAEQEDQPKELETIELLATESLDFQMGFYNLCDGVRLHPDYHPRLREEVRFKKLNAPFREHRLTSAARVGNLMEHRWSVPTATHEEWVDLYTSTYLTYTSLIFLARVAAERLQYEPTTQNLNFLLNALWLRIFTQTEEGFARESFCLEWVRHEDGDGERASGEIDLHAHLDLISSKAAYQVKTPRFLIPTSNEGHRKDQINNLRHQSRFQEEQGLPVFYLVPSLDLTSVEKISLRDAVYRCHLEDYLGLSD